MALVFLPALLWAERPSIALGKKAGGREVSAAFWKALYSVPKFPEPRQWGENHGDLRIVYAEALKQRLWKRWPIYFLFALYLFQCFYLTHCSSIPPLFLFASLPPFFPFLFLPSFPFSVGFSQALLKLAIFLLQPPKCWGYRCTPLYLSSKLLS